MEELDEYVWSRNWGNYTPIPSSLLSLLYHGYKISGVTEIPVIKRSGIYVVENLTTPWDNPWGKLTVIHALQKSKPVLYIHGPVAELVRKITTVENCFEPENFEPETGRIYLALPVKQGVPRSLIDVDIIIYMKSGS